MGRMNNGASKKSQKGEPIQWLRSSNINNVLHMYSAVTVGLSAHACDECMNESMLHDSSILLAACLHSNQEGNSSVVPPTRLVEVM